MSEAPRIDSIIFDLGNVLIHCDLDLAAREIARQAHLPADEVKRRLTEHPIINEFDEGRYTGEEFAREIERLLGWRGTAEELEQIWQDMLHGDDAMFDYLESLISRGYRTYILSNANPFHTEFVKMTWPKVMKTHGQIFSCECRMIKPNEAIFHHARETFGIEPDMTVFVDDRRANIEAARRVGFHGILHRSLPETREQIEGMLSREGIS